MPCSLAKANLKIGCLEFEQAVPRAADPLMGWTSSDDTTTQVKLKFATSDDAEAYAKRKGIAYRCRPKHL